MDPKVGPTVDRVLQLVAKRFAEFQNTLPNERLDTRSGVCAERIRRDQPGMVSLAPIPRNIKHPTTPNMHSPDAFDPTIVFLCAPAHLAYQSQDGKRGRTPLLHVKRDAALTEPSLDLYCLRGRPLIRNAKRIRMLPCFSVRPPSIPYPRVRLVLVGGRTFVPPRSRTRPKRRILGPFAGKRAEEPHNGRRHLADIHSAQLQGGTNVTPPAVSPPSCGGDAS